MAGKGRKAGTGTFEQNKSDIDWNIVQSLCKIQCTDVEVAQVIGVEKKTLCNRCKAEFNCTFQEYSLKFRKEGTSSLRRAQYKSAVEKLNPTMLIWLGKQYLNQKDSLDVDYTSDGEKLSALEVAIMSPEQATQYYKSKIKDGKT